MSLRKQQIFNINVGKMKSIIKFKETKCWISEQAAEAHV
jgi:hypothetical protein